MILFLPAWLVLIVYAAVNVGIAVNVGRRFARIAPPPLDLWDDWDEQAERGGW